MRWAGHVARMGEKRNVYRLLNMDEFWTRSWIKLCNEEIQILLEWSNLGWYGNWGIQYIWEKKETPFWWEGLKERDHLEDLGVDEGCLWNEFFGIRMGGTVSRKTSLRMGGCSRDLYSSEHGHVVSSCIHSNDP
jgi:hypothetical protein